MTAGEKRLVAEIKALLDEHDRAETHLVKATRVQMKLRAGELCPEHAAAARRLRLPGLLKTLWREHDLLERRLIELAARLPQPIVAQIQAGEL